MRIITCKITVFVCAYVFCIVGCSSPESFNFEVRVLDQSTGDPITDAEVRIIGGQRDVTNDDGIATLSIQETDIGKKVDLIIQAKGYEEREIDEELKKQDRPLPIQLSPIIVSSSTPDLSTNTPPSVLSIDPPPPNATDAILPADTPLPNPTDLPVPSNNWAFDFDSSIQNWNTSEGQYKEAALQVGSLTYSGNGSLLLSTELRYDSEDNIFQHTEVTGYFSTAIPQGAPGAGPYNLIGKLVSCWIYVPAKLAALTGNPQTYVQLFVKDINYRNEFGAYEDITTSNTDQWMQLSFQVNSVGGDDPTYDPTQINALGIRINLQNSATVAYNTKVGDTPIYIDACTIEAP